jgi:predicted transcriptional regulator
MRIVWELKSCAARDVYQLTKEKYGWVPGTTKTFLRRLVEKGYLKTNQVGNCYVYEPVTSPLKSLYRAADVLMENALEGTAAPLVFRMVKQGNLSDSDIEELRSMLDRYEGNKGEQRE